jgi:hypothetical protein
METQATAPTAPAMGVARIESAVPDVNRGGRPTVRTPEVARILCDAIALGVPFRHACNVAKISFQTFCDWRRDDLDFKEQVEGALAEGVQRRLRVIEKAMESTDEAIRLRSACWYLEHVFPSDFSRSRVEVEAIGQFDHTFVIPRETLDQIAEARTRREREFMNGGASAALPEAKTPATT